VLLDKMLSYRLESRASVWCFRSKNIWSNTTLSFLWLRGSGVSRKGESRVALPTGPRGATILRL